MPKLNPALFNPLTRIENACRRASGIMLTAPNPPKDCRLVWREIQEIRDALEAFKAAAEAGEMTGFKDGAIRSHETEPSKAFRHSISKASGEGSKEASRSRAQFRKEVTSLPVAQQFFPADLIIQFLQSGNCGLFTVAPASTLTFSALKNSFFGRSARHNSVSVSTYSFIMAKALSKNALDSSDVGFVGSAKNVLALCSIAIDGNASICADSSPLGTENVATSPKTAPSRIKNTSTSVCHGTSLGSIPEESNAAKVPPDTPNPHLSRDSILECQRRRASLKKTSVTPQSSFSVSNSIGSELLDFQLRDRIYSNFQLSPVHLDPTSDLDVLSFNTGKHGRLFTGDAGGIHPVKVWFGSWLRYSETRFRLCW
jgi:hypothetical protein